MKTIYPNKRRIFFKAVILVTLLVLIYSVTKQLTASAEVANILLSGLLLLVYVALAVVLMISFLGIFKVEADSFPNQFTFYKIFSKQVLPASTITGYYITTNTTKYGTSYGRILKTINDKIIVLDPANLNDINQIDEYLKAQNIEYLGEKTLSLPFIYAIKSTI